MTRTVSELQVRFKQFTYLLGITDDPPRETLSGNGFQSEEDYGPVGNMEGRKGQPDTNPGDGRGSVFRGTPSSTRGRGVVSVLGVSLPVRVDPVT